ncbi:MAG: matrixin [Candidatus Taylorbacteria bacterium]|nr:matrixin [Candidatus Taylorbacteria bacterium]
MKHQSRRSDILSLVSFLLIFGAFVFYYQGHHQRIASSVKNIVRIVRPCAFPLTYSIGRFDEQFDISQEELLDDVKLAAGKWENALGKDLFVFDPDNSQQFSDIKINLEYDYRQKTTDKLDVLGGSIEQTRAKYNTLKSKYVALKEELARKKGTLDDLMAIYRSSKNHTEELVQRIRAAESDYNDAVNAINSLVPDLNAIGKQLNITVTSYNTIGAANGPEFDEGEYVSDKTGASINIYQFNDKQRLLRLLEHELGHALGLSHIANPDAIMYRLNSGDSLELTQLDIDALVSQCKI